MRRSQRQRSRRPSSRVTRRRLTAETLERRHLLAVTFQFDFVEDNAIGFNDPIDGGTYRLALQAAADRLGDSIVDDATILMTVESLPFTGDHIAGAASILPPASAGGGFTDALIPAKIKGQDDSNGSAADGRLEVRFPDSSDSLQFELDPNDVQSDELDFGAVIIHELVHAIGWTSATTESGADDNGGGLGTPGTWRPYDAFLSDSAGARLIDGDSASPTAFEIDAGRWATESVGGPGTLTPGAAGDGLYFAGPIATKVYGGPVPLFSPDPFLPESSVVHLDSEGVGDSVTPFDPASELLSHGIRTGPAPQQLTLVEQAILADIGIRTVESVAPTLNLPPLNLFLEGNTTGGYAASGVELTQYLATISADDQLDPSPSIVVDLPPTLPIGTNLISVTATDWSGNVASGTLTIVVNDSTPPQLSIDPAAVTLEATSAAGVERVTLPITVSATDIVDANPLVEGAPSSFPLGETVVTYTARDFRSNVATADVTVTVVDTTPPVWNQNELVSITGNTLDGSTLDNPELSTALADTFSDAVDTDLDFRWNVDELVYGVNAVTVIATDDFGNETEQALSIDVIDDRIEVTTSDDENDVDPGSPLSDVSLREAIQMANDRPGHDVIVFASSVTDPVVLDSDLGTLSIRDSVSLYGFDRNTSIIDGNDAVGIFRVAPSADNVWFEGLTIRNGLTQDEFGFGAGIRFDSSGLLTIRDSVVTGNLTTNDGGAGAGVQSTDGDVRIERSVISDNRASGPFAGGGGVWTGGGSLTITDSVVSGNSTGGGYATGGGVYALGGEVLIQRSTIENNRTEGNRAGGAGVSALVGNLRVVDSTIANNFTEGTQSPGGGIRSLRTTVTIQNSTVTGNSATGSNAGGIELDKSSATIIASTIAENTASLAGGGIHTTETPTLVNLAGSVVAGNQDNQTAPDLFAGADALGSVRFSLIGNNTGTALAESSLPAPDNGNLIGDPDGGGVIDPRLLPLADNGGPTQTRLPAPDSPLVDAGDPDFDGQSLDPAIGNDQRGPAFARITNNRIDIGSVERVTDVVVQWDSPETIVFRTPLSPEQLDAVANVPGTFEYSPPAGVLLSASNSHTLQVTFTPDDANLSAVTTTTTIAVLRATPSIVWQPPSTVIAGVALGDRELSATADVTGTFVYDPPAGTVLSAGADQTLSVTFTPSDTLNFLPVTATVSVDVTGGRDFGDAPAPYPVALADDGPSHGDDSGTVGSLFLGSGVTLEPDGTPSTGADADGSDDGFSLISPLVADPAATTTTTARIVASADGRLDGWIDFNGDGDWNDLGERVATAFSVTAGVNRLPILVPAGSSVGNTVARFRLSTRGGLMPTGSASDGEVEDHLVTIGELGSTPIDWNWDEASAVVTEENGRWVILADGVPAVSVPQRDGLQLTVSGSDLSQTITIPIDLDQRLGTVSIDGATQRNTLVVTGDGVLDLTQDDDSYQNLRVLDLSDAASQRILIDSASLQRLSPIAGVLEVTLADGDRLDLRDRSGWQLINDDPANPTSQTAVSPDGNLEIQATVDAVWTNFVQPADVDNNGEVTPLDALRVINEIRRRRLLDGNTNTLISPADSVLEERIYPDLDGSGTMTPLDALTVINTIRRNRSAASASGESSAGSFASGGLSVSALAPAWVPIAQIESTANGHSENRHATDQALTDWLASLPGSDQPSS